MARVLKSLKTMSLLIMLSTASSICYAQDRHNDVQTSMIGEKSYKVKTTFSLDTAKKKFEINLDIIPLESKDSKSLNFKKIEIGDIAISINNIKANITQIIPNGDEENGKLDILGGFELDEKPKKV